MNKIVLFIIIFSTSLMADSLNVSKMKNVDNFVKLAKETSLGTHSIKCEFTQQKHLSFISETIISKGVFCYKKENLLRWEYNDPFEYIIVINDGEILIKDNNKISSFSSNSNKMFSEINNIISRAFTGNIFNSDMKLNYYETKTNYIVKYSPSNNKIKQFISNIVLHFDKSNLSLSRVELIEENGDLTNIVFTKKELNGKIPDEIFILD